MLKTKEISNTENYRYEFEDEVNIVYAAAYTGEVTTTFCRYAFAISNSSKLLYCFYLNSTVSDTRVYLSKEFTAVILYS